MEEEDNQQETNEENSQDSESKTTLEVRTGAPSNNWKTVQQYSSQEMELSNVSLICDFTAQSFRLFDGVLWVTS